MKRTLAFLLTVAMLLSMVSMLPTPVWAADVVASGTWDSNLTWTLDSNGHLTISGEGDMKDFGEHSESAWLEYRNEILTVTIESGVTSIGEFAFGWCDSLTAVTLPEDLAYIGSATFFCCEGLSKINLPSTLTEIDESGFYGCSSLTEIILPEGLSDIYYLTFGNCSSLTSITIPAGVTYIDEYAFDGCAGLAEIIFEGDAPEFGEDAFNSVVAEVYYPKSNSTWTVDVMQDYGGTLTWVPNGENQAPQPELIASGAWGDNLTWTLDDEGHLSISGEGEMDNFSSWRDDAWQRFGNEILTVTIANGVTSIGNSAFFKCGSLTEITIPEGVTNIGEDAFYGCSSLLNIYVDAANTAYCSIDGALSSKDGKTMLLVPGGKTGTYTIPEGVTSIGDYAFQACSRLTEISIPNTVTSIGRYAFYECSRLTRITIGSGLTSYGYGLFLDCCSLTDIVVDTANEEYRSIDGVMFSKDGITLLHYPCGRKGEYIIPYGVTIIESYAFDGCKELTAITIPASVTGIGKAIFDGCYDLYSITFCGDAPAFHKYAFDGVGINETGGYEEGDTLYVYYPADNATWTEDVMRSYGGIGVDWIPYTPHSHSYTAVVTAPTCTEGGYTTYTCHCGDSYVGDEVAALGHDYVEGTCSRCGEVEELLGDVNGDGKLNARDARVLLRAIAGLDGDGELDPDIADFNGDGKVNARDARALLRKIAGLE